MNEGRARRVAELVREEVAQLLMKGLKDPRVGFVSVMDVRMSADLRYATVYVSLYGDEKQKKGSLAGLRSSAGWMRREVAKRIRLRVAPEIRFMEDTTLDEAFHLEEIFREMHAGKGESGAAPAETESTGNAPEDDDPDDHD